MGAKYTKAQKQASIKYLKENTDDIRIRVPKGKKDEYKQLAELNRMSLNAYIVRLLDEQHGRNRS